MAENVQDILLREVIHPVLTTKGSILTSTEMDESFIAIFNDIVGLDNPGQIPAWDEDVIYNTTNLRYVSHDTFLWLSLQNANKGNTPQDPSAFWARVSVGQLAHEINKDDTLDLGGLNEVTASEIKTHLDSNPQLGSVTDIVNAMEPPPGSPSEVDGRSYILDRDSLVFTPVSAVWQTGIKVKIDLSSGSPGPDFTDIEAGDFLCIEGFDNDVNNGSFPIDEVNVVDDFIVIINAGRTDGSLDENPAPVTAKAHSTHADWDGGCRDDRVTYNAATDKWIGQTPSEGATIYDISRETHVIFKADIGWQPMGGALRKKVTLTVTQLLALNSAPPVIIPKAGVGTVIELIGLSGRLNFGSAAYVLAGGDMALFETDSSGTLLTNWTVALNDFLDRGADEIRQATIISQSQAIILQENKDIVLSCDTGDPITGDSTVDIYVTYRILYL